MPARPKPIYQRLASLLVALRNCETSGNSEWAERHAESIKHMMQHAPHGGGFDSGTQLDMDQSSEEKLVFKTAYHHMNDAGYYDGWTEHIITVTPSFDGFHLKVSGRDRNDIKDYIHDAFENFLDTYVERE